MDWFNYLSTTVLVIIGIIHILILIFPNQSKQKLTRLGVYIKEKLKFLLQLKHLLNLLSISFGVLIILFTLNNESIIVSNHDNSVFGANAVCKDTHCTFPISGGNYAFFNMNLKFDSMTTLTMKYKSDSDQIIVIGTGAGLLGYKEFEFNVERTFGEVKEITLLSNVGDLELCPDCFQNFWQKWFGSLGKQIFVKISPEKDIQVSYIQTASKGAFNIYRVTFLLVGLFYILVGLLVGYRKTN